MALLLHHANISKGSNILLIENTKGLVLGAVVQRLNGKGDINLCSNNDAKKNLKQLYFYGLLNIDKALEKRVKTTSIKETLAISDLYSQ